MQDALALAQNNLLSPMVLFFALGFLAAAAKSDLVFPEAVAKALSLYLLIAIGFKGGVIVADEEEESVSVTAPAPMLGVTATPSRGALGRG